MACISCLLNKFAWRLFFGNSRNTPYHTFSLPTTAVMSPPSASSPLSTILSTSALDLHVTRRVSAAVAAMPLSGVRDNYKRLMWRCPGSSREHMRRDGKVQTSFSHCVCLLPRSFHVNAHSETPPGACETAAAVGKSKKRQGKLRFKKNCKPSGVPILFGIKGLLKWPPKIGTWFRGLNCTSARATFCFRYHLTFHYII